jgi:hypothetical protein
MIKRVLACIVLAAFVSVSTGCYGSFMLTKKFYNWNGSLGNKFVKSIVFWAFNIIPVYGVCAFADAFVLNLIEFWAGSNPMALNADTELQKTVENNGKVYDVTMGKGMITIVETKGPDAGKKITLTYKKDQSAWYLSDGVTSQMVASFDPKPLNNVNLYYPDGSVVSKSLDTPDDLAVAVR